MPKRSKPKRSKPKTSRSHPNTPSLRDILRARKAHASTSDPPPPSVTPKAAPRAQKAAPNQVTAHTEKARVSSLSTEDLAAASPTAAARPTTVATPQSATMPPSSPNTTPEATPGSMPVVRRASRSDTATSTASKHKALGQDSRTAFSNQLPTQAKASAQAQISTQAMPTMAGAPHPDNPVPPTASAFTGSSRRIPPDIEVAGKRVNLQAWKQKNAQLTWLLMLGSIAVLGLISWLAARAFSPEYAFFFVLIAVLVGGSQSVVAYWFSDRITLRLTGARPATLDEHRYLVHITEAVALGAGIPKPRLYVIDSAAPNAFATGRNPKHSTVTLTTGLIAMLDRQELEAVVAHEIAHIRNHDVLIGSMLTTLLAAVVVLRDLIARIHPQDSKNKKGGNGAHLILLIFLLIAPLIVNLLRMAVSRRREYVADATGAYITRNPDSMARALSKLQSYQGEKLAVSESVQHLFFINPAKALNAQNPFATHPPLEARIQMLRGMSA